MAGSVNSGLRWALLALALAGCASEDPSSERPAGDVMRAVHGEGEGPLSASSGDGAVSITPPKARDWSGSFGYLLLCKTGGGQEGDIVLERVRPEYQVQPRDVEFNVRTVTAEQVRTGGRFRPFYTHGDGRLFGQRPVTTGPKAR